MLEVAARSPSKADCSGTGSISGTAGPRPNPAGLYVSACAQWPTLAFRLFGVVVPLLLLLTASSSGGGSARGRASAGCLLGPLGSPIMQALLQLCLGAIQLLCARQASVHASWRMALAADAAHLLLVAGVHF